MVKNQRCAATARPIGDGSGLSTSSYSRTSEGKGASSCQRRRAFIASLQRLGQGEADALSANRDNARGYRNLLRAHLYKKNNVLFPMAERCIPDGVAATLKDLSDEIDRDRDRVDAANHEAYHAMLIILKSQYGVE